MEGSKYKNEANSYTALAARQLLILVPIHTNTPKALGNQSSPVTLASLLFLLLDHILLLLLLSIEMTIVWNKSPCSRRAKCSSDTSRSSRRHSAPCSLQWSSQKSIAFSRYFSWDSSMPELSAVWTRSCRSFSTFGGTEA